MKETLSYTLARNKLTSPTLQKIKNNLHLYGYKVYLCSITLRGRAGVARWAHNPKVTSSNLVPATERKSSEENLPGFFVFIGEITENIYLKMKINF